MPFRFPKPTQRTVILGATGSGKSVFGLWVLSYMNFEDMPWVIVDYKGDDLLEEILEDHNWKVTRNRVVRGFNSPIKEISPTDPVPKKPGLYYMRPNAKID